MGLCPTCGRRASGGFAYCPDDGAELLLELEGEATAPLPRQLDRYRLLRKIGQGGTSDVFEAEHVHIGKRVALKLLRRQLAGDERAVERLRREARTASSVGHPNIVHIEDFGVTSDGVVYLAMEWLEGETLAQRIERGPVRADVAVDLAIQIAAGLGAAHAAGVIHRDMKPANVFLARQPDGRERAVLLDFGIAKLALTDTRLTRTGTFIGTPDYVAPEQALGEELDGRADLYALGVVLYQLCTGTLPFTAGNFMAVLHRHTTEAPEPPRRRAPQRALSPALEAVVLRCMAKRPDDRYASAEELVAALEAARRSGLSAVVPPAGAATGDYAEGPRPTTEIPAESQATPLPWADEADESMPRRRGRPALWLAVSLIAGGAIGAAAFVLTERPAAVASSPDAGTAIEAIEAIEVSADAGAIVTSPVPAPNIESTLDAGVPAEPGLPGSGFTYRVSTQPRLIRPGRPFHFQVTIRPGADLAATWRRRSRRARVTFHHAATRRVELRGEFPLDGNRLSAELSLPRSGTHRVEVLLQAGRDEVGRAEFAVCVGADPSGPAGPLERACPGARPGELTPRVPR